MELNEIFAIAIASQVTITDNKIIFVYKIPGMIEFITTQIEATEANKLNIRKLDYQCKLELSEKYLVNKI